MRAVGLAPLRAVYAAEADRFSYVVVQNLDGIAVENSDYFVLILRDSDGWRVCEKSEDHNEGP